VIATGTRGRKPFKANHQLITSVCTIPDALLRLVRERWSIESWHWIRDTKLREDAHHYQGNDAGIMAKVRSAALNLLRLAGFGSIREGLQALMHDIAALLAMTRRQPETDP
jgi:hypothetical protein